jgi:hypothetical protein
MMMPTSLFAENITTVTVEGFGDNLEYAKKDASNRALNKVIESYVSTKIILINEETISDRILRFNRGYIKSIDVFEQGISKEMGGMYFVKAKVEVIVDQLVQKLEDENITTIADPTFITKVIEVFDSTDKFREVYKKDVLEPIFNNGLPDGSAYNIKFRGMEPYVDDSSSGLKEQESIYHFVSKEDKKKYGNLEIMPFYFNFKVSLRDEYINETKKLYGYLANGNKKERVCRESPEKDDEDEKDKSTNCCKESSVCIVELKDPPENENWFIGATATEYIFSSIHNRIVNNELEKIKNLYDINRHSGAYFKLKFIDKDKDVIGSVILGGEGAKPIKGSKYSSTSIITHYGGWGKPWHKNIAPMISGFYINKKALINNNQTFVAIVLLSEEEAVRIKDANLTITWLKPTDSL